VPNVSNFTIFTHFSRKNPMRFPQPTRKPAIGLNMGPGATLVDAEVIVPEDLVGKVCVCSTGRVGLVTSKGSIEVPDRSEDGCPLDTVEVHGWHGIGLDGKGTWFSSAPVIVAENAEEFRQRLSDRFGGRMTAHD
jgi:hypothetical protein